MKDHYRISVDGNYQFELGTADAINLNQAISPDAGLSEKNQKIHVLHNHKSFSAEIIEADFNQKKYRVKVNGIIHNILIETPLSRLIEEMGLSLGKTSIEDEVFAPMPGIILEVNVSEEDIVKKGDFLCVLEAMKMENALTAPKDGIIKSVNIVRGATVDKGKLLIEFHKND